MLKNIFGFVVIVLGIIMVIISILALVKAFGLFNQDTISMYGYGYLFGSIIFPLLLTVTGRWVYRIGRQMLRKSAS